MQTVEIQLFFLNKLQFYYVNVCTRACTRVCRCVEQEVVGLWAGLRAALIAPLRTNRTSLDQPDGSLKEAARRFGGPNPPRTTPLRCCWTRLLGRTRFCLTRLVHVARAEAEKDASVYSGHPILHGPPNRVWTTSCL